MRLKASGYGPGIPARLDRATVTLAQAREALGQSAAAMVQLIERSLAAGGHVADFRPDVVALVCDAATNGSAGPTPTGRRGRDKRDVSKEPPRWPAFTGS